MSGIDTLPSAEQDQIVDAVSRFLADVQPLSRLRHGRATASLSADQWRAFGQQGWLGLPLAIRAGGAGCEFDDAALAHRAYARHLVTPSVIATVVAAKLASEKGETELAAELIAGEAHAALAVERPRSEGPAFHLVDAERARVVLQLSAEGARLVPAEAFVAVTPIEPIDSTVPLARASMAPATPSRPFDAVAGLWAKALLASELAGLAQATSALATAYAAGRQQFGKPIGSFQAVAHSCADCAMRAEAAVAQSNFASIAVAAGGPDAAYQVAAACLVSSDAALRNATANIHIHGAMGFSAESDAHLHLKRTILLKALAGGDAGHGAALEAGRS